MRVLITGSTDGIGKQTALALASSGFEVIVHGRDTKKVEETKKLIGCKGIVADLSCLKEIDNIVSIENESIDILINNAGVYNKNYKLSCDDFELTFAVNYLAHFYLTLSLLQQKIYPKIIINISSMVHADYIDMDDITRPHSYDPNEAYAVSKLCNILFSYYLTKRVKHLGILVNAMHPGVINTKMLIDNWGAIGENVEKGALNVLKTLETIQKNSYTGMYFVNANPTKSKAISYNSIIQEKLWQLSMKLCNLSDLKLD
ncbi:oxidoreductase, short-chain dehydrogenase/reductase family [Desulfurella amilsii]|uniref:Oxidoreductase, short-chain dehydrogenase/reductase family n=1 Tax=Desulfurella amilsii TaxID=1562698 RepID=A0A1X4XUZ9_9BACT|nr:SDR family NAD(P)-dependent oxidoreductase [Desulfurella amilsii]OSS41367.1 oxidoreductase, short-chain dehydrogenase/reductase family [Desulfurella amilsii]